MNNKNALSNVLTIYVMDLNLNFSVEIEPLSLQEQCRVVIRNLLRKVIESEHSNVKQSRKDTKTFKKKKRYRLSRFSM